MAIALPPEVKQLIDRPNFAHLATLMSDGSPQSVPVWVPVWVDREGEHIVVCTGKIRSKRKTRAAIREWQCPSWISPIPTRKFRSVAASSSDAPIPN
jgi:predicted pyridoxine 5'-phosphate oxidase superfamily flavin-nucleotide-binding protein